jgi:hypothetical protein
VKFVEIRHPKLGTTTVPESRVPHLSEGWKVIDDQPTPEPVKRAPRARASRRKES